MHYHIVGIAGAGMNAIAHLLLDQGHTVSGSDLTANRQTEALARRGVLLHIGHDPAYVAGADAVVATSAALADHPELREAEVRGIPLLRRADLWREWSQQRPVVAVAGTHGKTTTTAMIALVLMRCGVEAGFLVGAEIADLDGGARWGAPTAPLVIEADEYDRTFLALTPRIAVITNIEWDHPDIYPTPDDYLVAFTQFAGQTHDLVLAGSEAATLLGSPPVQLLTFGLDPGCDYRATDDEEAWQITAGPHHLCTLRLAVPGLHNITNALAALAVAHRLGLDMQVASSALTGFRGAARRFELKGNAAGITVIDDYAHHPTEVRATLAAAREWYPDRRIVAYVQPHTFSRTEALMEEWPGAFDNAHLVLVGDIYAAREQGDAAESARRLTESIAVSHPATIYVGDLDGAIAAALAHLRVNDVLLTLGAGDGYRVGELTLARLRGDE